MKWRRFFVLAFAFFLFACQPATTISTVTILDTGEPITLQTNERIPAAILAQANITLGPKDTVIANGLPVDVNTSIADQPLTLQIRRAANVFIITPEGQKAFQTSALTVGEVLKEAGITVHENDEITPSINSPVTNPLTIHYVPSQAITISVDGKSVQVNSSAKTVGEALAEARIPLFGLDYSHPSENEALPSDGQIKVVRVSESVILVQKSIPFTTQTVPSTDIPLDQTQILSPGEEGLSIQRVRVRYEDGQEVARVTEDETTVRPPTERVLAYGTKVEIKTATVDGVTIQYWRSIQMYATSYSPCGSGVSGCSSRTASGATVKKGVVALRTDLYLSLRGQQLYIPGYGFASVEDACGGCVGKPWIDLGYSDSDYQQWSSSVTVYFLAPAPANIPYDLQ